MSCEQPRLSTSRCILTENCSFDSLDFAPLSMVTALVTPPEFSPEAASLNCHQLVSPKRLRLCAGGSARTETQARHGAHLKSGRHMCAVVLLISAAQTHLVLNMISYQSLMLSRATG